MWGKIDEDYSVDANVNRSNAQIRIKSVFSEQKLAYFPASQNWTNQLFYFKLNQDYSSMRLWH